MYYLEDKHPQYEYSCYIRVGHGTPYIAPYTLTDIQSVYREIRDIEHKHNRYHQPFYIDNDFYKNEYSLEVGGTYYKFLVRPVNDWKILKTKKKNVTKRVLKFAE